MVTPDTAWKVFIPAHISQLSLTDKLIQTMKI
jgi:hypothetical protein